MPDWDDGRSWPRRPRSPADAIRPPRKPGKWSCPLELAAATVLLVCAGTASYATATATVNALI